MASGTDAIGAQSGFPGDEHLFGSLVESRRERKSPGRLIAIQVAVVAHVIVLLSIAIRHVLEVPPIPEPTSRASFAQLAPPPPPPPPPPAAPKPTPEVEVPTQMVEPLEMPKEINVEPSPEPPSPDEGVEGGVEGGVPGGVLPTDDLYRVGGPASEPKLLHRVEPKYPAAARAARVQGVVILEAIIRRDGSVGNVRPLRQLSMGLTEAAVEAVKQWRYKPAMLFDEPVEFALTVTVNFKLGK